MNEQIASCRDIKDYNKSNIESCDCLFSFYEFNSCKAEIPGYFVVSTAPTNLEEHNNELSEFDNRKNELNKLLNESEKNFPNKVTLEATEGEKTQTGLDAIACKIQEKNENAGACSEVELVIAIHGYNTAGVKVMNWYKKILDFANKEAPSKNFVFLGYRWPSETLPGNCCDALHAMCDALRAMPLVLQLILGIGFVGITGVILSLLFKLSLQPLMFSLVIFLATALFSLPITLVIIRLSVYLRDSYRATNFGTPDLVELIRLLDDKLLTIAVNYFCEQNDRYVKDLQEEITKLRKYFELKEEKIKEKSIRDITTKILKDYLQRENYWVGEEINIPKLLLAIGLDSKKIDKASSELPQKIKDRLNHIGYSIKEGFKEVAEKKEKFGWIAHDEKRIKLTFLCHSMGAFVTTGAVRILSDVFDSSSIGLLDQSRPEKLPTSNIGHVFRLGRLILVSPDIPQLAITSNRANFLQASLRRFEEAYLFSNEGDMALLVASTSANYSLLPTKTGARSFRLGNVAVKKDYECGIVNLSQLNKFDKNCPGEDLLTHLEVGGYCLKSIRAQTPSNLQNQYEQIANLFSYFDCTDYTDRKFISVDKTTEQEKLTKKRCRILSWLLTHPPSLLNPYGILSYPLKFLTQSVLTLSFFIPFIDTHGGYFSGEFSRRAIYHLAFGGFESLLRSFEDEKLKTLKVEECSAIQENLDSLEKQYTALLCKLDKMFRRKRIRAVLSLERYLVDVKKWDRNQARKIVLSGATLSHETT